jgi:putative ATP-dependent endonuclease of the OLD family
MDTPTKYRLAIERFRALRACRGTRLWALTMVLGGGDVDKTTILDAIAL